MSNRLVYYFGRSRTDGGRDQKSLLGGKGANLAEMTRIGVPVPPGFTITTEVCRAHLQGDGNPEGTRREVSDCLRLVEEETGKRFGASDSPLLVSVRSGAAISMPGMMDTILNLGLNDETAAALARSSGDERFANDSYRRFVQMYGEVVLGVAQHRYSELLDAKKAETGVEHDTGLDAGDLRELVKAFKRATEEETGSPFPEDPWDQLWQAIDAVFDSWNTERAIQYRRVHRIAEDLGTAVNVVTMVYGNMGEDSGTGVAFTRDPSTGEKRLFGEFLLNAQGEDVVAGIRDPLSIGQMKEEMPEQYRALEEVGDRLEAHYRDVQDMEFTVERGDLYLLQTRTAKRSAPAAVRIAVEMVEEGLIDEPTAVRRVPARQLDQLLHPQIDPSASVDVLTRGLPASPGAESGRVVLSPERAQELAAEGQDVILVREETSPDDFGGMVAAKAILTARGGMTSHAAVVARGMGKCCVVGARDLRVDESAATVKVDGRSIAEGDWITLDGSTGRVLAGRVPTIDALTSEWYDRLMEWADSHRRLRVRANADTPEDAARAREFGAEGIGLCRTEHMFFRGDRIDTMREMILAQDEAGRRRALDRLLPMQRDDFEGIFRAMAGLPVTIRLLDPPLHEFLPKTRHEIEELSARLGVEADQLARRSDRLREINPMLGHRGVRLGLTYPEVTEMQTRAIFEAAVKVAREGVEVRPEVMVPLVAVAEELRRQDALIREVADGIIAESGLDMDYLVGTMIELPRAALTAGEIAKEAEFFSFGTNDLTQTTLGLSRDDSGTFLPRYIEQGILDDDPFQRLDQSGVGRLVELATREGREARPGLKVGICGEHGGDPASVAFFHRTGLDYVSCSPFRVPVARLAAAQAALDDGTETSSHPEAQTRDARERQRAAPPIPLPSSKRSAQGNGRGEDARAPREEPREPPAAGPAMAALPARSAETGE